MQLHSLSKQPSRPDDCLRGYLGPRTPIANLRETARLTGPYQIWVTDVAYAHIRSGLVYAQRSLMHGRGRWLDMLLLCRSRIGWRA
jgi:hypothetical protein